MDKNLNIPKVSVIMPVYNCEQYVGEAIESILNQTFPDFELLIIDDASSDSTVSIIKNYSDSRLKLIEKPKNSGYTNSLNYGLSIARGEYIARMDGDDISLPERFEKQIAFLNENREIALCGSLFTIIGTKTIVHVPENHSEIRLTLLSHCCFGHPTIMMRKEILDQFSFHYDTSREPAEDYDLWSKLSVVTKLHNIQEVLVDYRVHDAQVSQKKNNQQIRNSSEIKLQLLNNLEFNSSAEEQNLLHKIFLQEDLFTFQELKQFQLLKSKLLKANEIGFFEPKGFSNYLLNLEYHICKQYFFRRDQYSPIIFFQYTKIKRQIAFNLTPLNQLKLLVKSLIFYKKK